MPAVRFACILLVWVIEAAWLNCATLMTSQGAHWENTITHVDSQEL